MVDVPQGSERDFNMDSSPNQADFSEFNESLNDSVCYKLENTMKKNHFDVTKQMFKFKSYSAHSVKGQIRQSNKPAFDATNISIMDIIQAKGPLSKLRNVHKNENPMKIKIKISSPLSINSRLCGEDSALYFDGAYENCQM